MRKHWLCLTLFVAQCNTKIEPVLHRGIELRKITLYSIFSQKDRGSFSHPRTIDTIITALVALAQMATLHRVMMMVQKYH
jgi:hypothetical protein